MSFSFHPDPLITLINTNGDNTVTTAATVSTEAPNDVQGQAPATTTTTFDPAASSSPSPGASSKGGASGAPLIAGICVGAFVVVVVAIILWRKFMPRDYNSDSVLTRHDGYEYHPLHRATVPGILEVPIGNTIYTEVDHQFTKQWKHRTQKPTVIKLWEIHVHRSVLERFSLYQKEVGRRMGNSGGNTCRRFHGTIRKCTLGDTSDDNHLCAQPSCNMCRIIEHSFQLARAGEHINFGRFGRGIYTTATSSKANDYAESSVSPNRAMLLNHVVVGKAKKLKMDDESLTEPPPGYDAVIGEPAPGGNLNYDECVVYNNDAIRPSFLIVYK